MNLAENSIWMPSGSLDNLKTRAHLLESTREFFKQRHVLEVETPILSRAGNPDPNIQSFTTANGEPLYLRTSPEFLLKRMLSAGYGDCYELGKVFRQAESGQFHNPEFTMLEWYRVGWTWKQLAKEVCDYIKFSGQLLSNPRFQQWPIHCLSFQELYFEYIGIDPFTAQIADFEALAKSLRLQFPDNMIKEDWLDLIMSTVIQPGLPESRITIVYDFPSQQAALAKINPDKPQTALRFEVYLGQQEIANGYQELTDARELAQRFENDNQKRKERQQAEVKLDHNLIAAQQQPLPECAGVALGFDRLLMAITKSRKIAECLSFDSERA